MEDTDFKEKVGTSHASLEDYKISFYKKFPYLLKIKYFCFHDVAEGSLKWDGSEEHLVMQRSDFPEFRCGSDQSCGRCRTLQTRFLQHKAGFTGDPLNGMERAWRNALWLLRMKGK